MQERSGAKVIVTESVFSMEGDIAPIRDLLRLARTYDAAIVLDEAHATGVLGPRGRGIAANMHANARFSRSCIPAGKRWLVRARLYAAGIR